MFFHLLHFESPNLSIVCQLAVHVHTRNLYARSSYKGQPFSAWRRLDVSRLASGVIDETVTNAQVAQKADHAGRLSVPVKIILSGDVNGEVRFDGSANVTMNTQVNASGVVGGLSASLEDIKKRLQKVEQYIENMGPTGGS